MENPVSTYSRFQSELKRCIEFRSTGAIIHLPPNLPTVGETGFVQERISETLTVPIYTFVRHKTPPMSESAFFKQLLSSVSPSASAQKLKTYELRKSVTNLIHQHARKSEKKAAVLCVENPQNMTMPDYEWLIDLQNELSAYGTDLTVLLVGDLELIKQWKRNTRPISMQAMQRFMHEEISSIQSPSDDDNNLVKANPAMS